MNSKLLTPCPSQARLVGLLATAVVLWRLCGLAAVANEFSGSVSALREAIAQGQPHQVADQAARLALDGGKKNMSALLSLLRGVPPSHDGIYWALVRGAASFSDREGLEALGDFIVKRKGALATDVCYGLARNLSPHAVVALRRVALDGRADLRELAARSLVSIDGAPTVEALIALLEREEKERPSEPTPLMWLAADGLARITGQRLGPNSVNWAGWWQRQGERGAALDPDAVEGEDAGGEGQPRTMVRELLGLDRERLEKFRALEKISPRQVVVLSAYFAEIKRDFNNDRIENELARMGVPHTVVERSDFLGFDLSETAIVLINCAQFHELCVCPKCVPSGGVQDRLYRCGNCNEHVKFSPKLPEEGIEKLRSFVHGGGYVFSEDWVVKEVIERAFPKFVVAGKKLLHPTHKARKPQEDAPSLKGRVPTVALKEAIVDVVPARGMGTHPYLRGIFTPSAPAAGAFAVSAEEYDDDEEDGTAGAPVPRAPRTVVRLPSLPGEPLKPLEVRHSWVIDDESFAFRVVDSRRVEQLLVSGDLQAATAGQGAVALAFRPGPSGKGPRRGRGRQAGVVVTMLSHFGRQPSVTDEQSVQNLLLNILFDAHAAFTGRGAGARGSR